MLTLTGGAAGTQFDSSGNYHSVLEVVKANAAPVLNASATPTLSSVSASAAAPVNGNTTAGDLVSTLVAGISDTDSGALQGIAITGVKAGATLHYSVDGGTTWVAATGVSDTNALLLAADSNTRVFYQANGTSGTVSDAITFRAWDQTQNITEGVYTSTIANGGKAQFSTATDTVSVTSSVTGGQSEIDLGTGNGKLIVPKQVGGEWFYYWDRSGDGTTANSGPLNGGVDYTPQNTLDAIFKYDINGVENTTVANADGQFGTTDVYRYGTINGVFLAMPVIGSTAAAPPSTAVSLNTTTVNPTYGNSMVGIMDAFNGTIVGGNPAASTETFWNTGGWHSATPSPTGHYKVAPSMQTFDYTDTQAGLYAILQIVKANTAPVLNAAQSPALTAVSASAAAPTGAVGDLVSTLVSGISDADSGALKGMAITGVHAGGTLYFSTNGGTTWTAASGLSNTNALLLASDSDTRVFYKANDSSGTISDAITFRAWDQTQNVAEGMYASTVSNGGKAEFSTATDTVSVVSTLPLDNNLNLGPSAVSGVRWNLINKVTAPNGKVYYHVDTSNNNNGLDASDYVTHDTLDTLFNGGADTTGLSNPAAGDDTERSVIVGGYTLVLPTRAEFAASLSTTTGWNTLYGWTSGIGTYWTADSNGAGNHWDANNNGGGGGIINQSRVDTGYTTNFAVEVKVPVAPVVLDLNRDGTFSYSQVAMDVNSDGRLDKTAWAGAQDGVLVWDKLGDGLVHDNSQYAFGQYATSTRFDAAGYNRLASDLDGLSDAFDTHRDGVFSITDEKFGEFRVWQDVNQNGVSDAGEVRSLADWGITSINLVSDGVQRTPVEGVTEAGQTTAETVDGSPMLVADAAFNFGALDYSVDGDKLYLLGAEMHLDLSSLVAAHSVTAVDLTGTGANTLKLSMDDVLRTASTDGVRTLVLTGDDNDKVVLDQTEWSHTGSMVDAAGHNYVVYSGSNDASVQLLIDQQMLTTHLTN
jgi:hypothetical protein